MADEEGKTSNVCTFTFKKRRGAALRRKAAEDGKSSSSDDETVVAKVEKRAAVGVLSAKTVLVKRFEFLD